MKKIVTLSIVCFFVGQLWAQIPAGAKLINANVGARFMSSSGIPNLSNYSLSTNFNATYSSFKKPNFCRNIGMEAYEYFRYSTRNNPNNGNLNNHFYNGLSLLFHYGYTKYYPLLPIHKQLFFGLKAFVAPEVTWGYDETFATQNSSFHLKHNTYNLGLNVGIEPFIAFQLKERWLLSAILGTARLHGNTGDINSGISSYQITGDLRFTPSSWSIGVGYFLSPKS